MKNGISRIGHPAMKLSNYSLQRPVRANTAEGKLTER